MLWHHRIDNHNMKVKYLIFLPRINKCWVLLPYYIHMHYTTWWYFNSSKLPHILDNFVFYHPLFCQVKDFKVVNFGIYRNHTLVQTTFKAAPIKFNGKKINTNRLKIIGYNLAANDLFNDNFSKSVNDGPNDSEFNTSTLEAGVDTATTNKQKNKG